MPNEGNVVCGRTLYRPLCAGKPAGGRGNRAAQKAALACPGAVATVGRLEVQPNAVNIVADKVTLSLDLRSMEIRELEQMEQQIFQALAETAAEAGVSYAIKLSLDSQPGYMDKQLVGYLQASALEQQTAFMRMHSGAGHDALPISARVPAAMLFVPSKGGRSHCLEEWSDCRHLAAAVDVMIDTIMKINKEES
ncbi:M20/M25/M40 family metallo-hydrolase [Selenomonas ruminantium]|uniref:M20/M25/M40 family metallo-hydrolase n=1 Tax=Selenomonas ruminantium TaxID=971 RepID=UPI0015BB9EA2|nr:M20/M25/M40 family metallo-hydrolase [Selenomonas ruminantium]